MKNKDNNNGVPGPAGRGEHKNGSSRHGRHIQGRTKGRPSTKSCGKMVGGEDSTYRCVVEIGFQKQPLLKRNVSNRMNTKDSNNGVAGPAGRSRKRAVLADTVDTFRGGRKGDLQQTVVGKR